MYRFPITIDKTKVQSVNNSTSFIDVSGKVWTAAGNAKLSTGDYEFAPASGVFDGVSGTYILTPDHADFATGTGDYTIDLWFKTTQVGFGMLFYQGDNDGNPGNIAHLLYVSSSKLYWFPDYKSYPSHTTLSSINNVNDNIWHHVACVRYGDVFTLYVDGIYQASVTLTGYFALDSTYPVTIGNMNTGTLGSFNGNIDEFRFSKGIARWTSGFIPPTSKYSSDSYTKILLHFGDDLTNFSYLFNELCSSIPSGFWSHVVDTTTGLDIRFFDTDGVTELKREIVLYNPGTSKVEAWVQILSLGTAANKVIYCQYGGVTRSNDTTVWSDLSAKENWHFQDSYNGALGLVNGTNYGTTFGLGKINRAISLNGSAYVDMGANISFLSSDSFVLSAWIKTSSTGYTEIMRRGASAGPYYILDVTDTNVARFIIKDNSGNSSQALGLTNIVDGNWHLVVGVRNVVTDKLFIYVDGVEDSGGGSSDTTTDNFTSFANNLNIGRNPFPAEYFTGFIDDVRIFKSSFLSDWIKTEYNNQNDPATFSLCSAEEDVTRIYKFPITIDKTKVQGTNSNFVYLFSEFCSSIPAGFWAHVIDTTGLDIRFFDTDSVTELKREIVLYNPGTSKVEAWVQIPSLGTAINKIIYCLYGGSTKANDYDLWDSLVPKGIYHLQSLSDSSTQNVSLTNAGASSTIGQIENGYNFNGSSYAYRTDTDDKQDITGSFTLSAWINLSSYGYATIIAKRQNGSGTHNYIFDVDPSGYIVLFNNGLSPSSLTSSVTVPTGLWSYVTAIYNGSTVKLYINGIERGSQSVTGTPIADSGPFGIGADYPGSWTDFFSGKIDEARVFASALSADWIKTEYNNQNSPVTFAVCGVEQIAAIAADFSAVPLTGDASLLVNFTDLSTGMPISWDWDFGDGSPHSTTQNPSHDYQNAGIYTIILIASNLTSTDIETKVDYITINMVADFSATPIIGPAPLTVNFADLSVGNPTSWDWDFGDSTLHSTMQNPSHIYTALGAFTVTLISSRGTTDTEIKSNYITTSIFQRTLNTLTSDTDSERQNYNTAVIVEPDGKRVVFYEKQLKSGLTNYSPITAFLTWDMPFTIHVPAGSGSINAISVSWSAVDVYATHDTYQLLYVSNTGTVTITDVWDSDLVKDVIILAFVYSGSSEITLLERWEKVGNYISVKSQTSPGVWDSKEYTLNVGEQPKAFIDVTGKIYLSYLKDSAVFVRIIDFSDPLTLSYLPHTIVSANMLQINMNPYPQSSLPVSLGSGYEGVVTAPQGVDLYPFAYYGVGYRKVLGVYQPFMYLPYLTGSYLSYINYPYYVEFFRYTGGSYVLVTSIAVYDLLADLSSLNRWFQWTYGTDTFYVGVRVNNKLINTPYTTLPANYGILKVFDPFELQTFPDPTHITDEIIERPTSVGLGSGHEGIISKTFEYETIRDYKTDNKDTGLSQGYQGIIEKTSEFETIRDYESDSKDTGLSTGYVGIITVSS